jgi:hypothetical protein
VLSSIVGVHAARRRVEVAVYDVWVERSRNVALALIPAPAGKSSPLNFHPS